MSYLETPRLNLDAVALRMMIITSFLLGATMILLSLNVSVLKQSVSAGSIDPIEWILAGSIVFALLSSMVMMFFSAVMLVTMDSVVFEYQEKRRVIARVRTMLGLTSMFVLASFGSTLFVALGTASPAAWILGGMGYAGAVTWGLLRGYYLSRFVHPREPKP